MTIRDALAQVRIIQYPDDSPPVVETAAAELVRIAPEAEIRKQPVTEAGGVGTFTIAVADAEGSKDLGLDRIENPTADAVYLQIGVDGSGWLVSSRPYYLFSFASYLTDHLADRDLKPYISGKVIRPAFRWQRVSYDYFLTQEGRIQRGLNRETYVRELARLGFTHIEVNGLASPTSPETGPEGEAYPMFYTYCPALDQFVSSELNAGLYPEDTLAANLAYLKENADLARRYGLIPGLLCFEPRSVSDAFFGKYPMLRGARVDHPFRSFKPRYNMTIAHPAVREHYAEMMRRLLKEVPELGFISIWSNDSGAGFEHTKSLYVGRNGGAYLIREWKDDREIARAAGENALRFFRVLQDAGREVNPDFRVLTRLESFYGEHEVIWEGLHDGLDVETASLVARGWELPYHHPKYPDSKAINAGTVYQQDFDKAEKPLMAELAKRGSRAHFYFSAGPHALFEPLLGVPYPRLTYQRLRTLRAAGVDYLAHSGGTFPPELVPYNVNHEIARRFQFDPELDIDEAVRELALRWAGETFCDELLKSWDLAEEAILAFPIITPLYATHGFTWYRLWARPLVPAIEAIPQDQRRYYEDFMCTTPHNPNNVDLSRDVLFQLTTIEKSRLDVERIDRNVWKSLDKAVEILDGIRGAAVHTLGKENVIRDQVIRLKALRCWLMTQRNAAAWIASVHGYLEATSGKGKAREREVLKDAIQKEMANTEELIKLFDSGVEFMALTDKGETELVHGDNLLELLAVRLRLMREHLEDEPYIDPEYMERKAGETIV